MSYFVLIYDRTDQTLLDLHEFAEQERTQADAFRLDAQRHALREALDQEIVLFQAESKESLKHSHGSYFLSESELLERIKATVEAR